MNSKVQNKNQINKEKIGNILIVVGIILFILSLTSGLFTSFTVALTICIISFIIGVIGTHMALGDILEDIQKYK